MTVLNFPDTSGKPTDGSFIYVANGVIYTWDGDKWTSEGQGSNPPDVRTGNLQEVTDLGNTTTNFITADGGFYSSSLIQSERTDKAFEVFRGRLNSTTTSQILAGGDATFADTVAVGSTATLQAYVNPGQFAGRTATKDTTSIFNFIGGYGGGSQETVVNFTSNGSATFAGSITSGSQTAATGGSWMQSNGGIFTVRADGQGAQPILQGGTNSDRDAVKINADGTITAAGDLKVSKAGTAKATVENTASSGNAFLNLKIPTNSLEFGVNPTNAFVSNSASVPTVFYAGGNETMRIDTTGNATFAGNGIFDGQLVAKENGIDARATSGSDPVFIGRTGTTPKSYIYGNGNATFEGTVTTRGGSGGTLYRGQNGVSGGDKIIFEDSGNARFDGTVTSNGTILTRADGTTLDVGERLEKVDTALTNLKAAVADASDFASLKSAIATALYDI